MDSVCIDSSTHAFEGSAPSKLVSNAAKPSEGPPFLELSHLLHRDTDEISVGQTLLLDKRTFMIMTSPVPVSKRHALVRQVQ